MTEKIKILLIADEKKRYLNLCKALLREKKNAINEDDMLRYNLPEDELFTEEDNALQRLNTFLLGMDKVVSVDNADYALILDINYEYGSPAELWVNPKTFSYVEKYIETWRK